MSDFLDFVELYVTSGNGGNGTVAFLRDALNAKGGPAGGKGGNGGDVIMKSDSSLRSLYKLRFTHHLGAGHGGNGGNNNKTGAGGDDLQITVPVGTTICDEEGNLVYDFKYNGESIKLQRGGRGGLGNASFKSSRMQKPRFALKGEKGNEKKYTLELKLLADIAIVGFPNAGKSTFISAVSNAKPKIADYPFTTLIPHQGIVYLKNGVDYILADIPGLIEGAHDGKGLGHKFLKHVERCRIILYMIDPDNLEAGEPSEQFEKLKFELKQFKKELTERPYLIAVNKSDLIDDEIRDEIKEQFPGEKIHFISARGKLDLKGISFALGQLIEDNPPKVEEAKGITLKVFEEEPVISDVKEVEPGYFRISGTIESSVAQIDFNQFDAVYFFHRFLKKQGLIKLIKQYGVKQGNVIIIGDTEFEFAEGD